MWKNLLRSILKNQDIDEINHVINNVILDKLSFLEIDIKDKYEETTTQIKSLKEVARIDRKEIRTNEEDIEENNDNIDELIRITQQLQVSNEDESRRVKKIVVKMSRGIAKMVNNQNKTINDLTAQNKMLNAKMDLIYGMLKDKN